MIVVKIGGGEGINQEAVCQDAASLIKEGQRVILVHGASHETNVISEKLGKPPRMVTSVSGMVSRYTDRETLEIFQMVYVGLANKRLVERLQQLGVNAIGLAGPDGRILEGSRKPHIKIVEDGKQKILRDDYTGKVERVNLSLIHLLVEAGYTIVTGPPAISYEGEVINVDGDRAAAFLAGQLKAESLVILSNVPGLLKDPVDESSLIPFIPRAQIERAMAYAQGRMKKKVLGAEEALAGGVSRIIFADGRVESPIRRALAGHGTTIH